MEQQIIKVRYKKEAHQYTVTDHPHHDNERCKYKVFEDGNLVATFEPDAERFLQLCQNPGKLHLGLINKLAEEIEAQLPHPGRRHFTKDGQ